MNNLEKALHNDFRQYTRLQKINDLWVKGLITYTEAIKMVAETIEKITTEECEKSN